MRQALRRWSPLLILLGMVGLLWLPALVGSRVFLNDELLTYEYPILSFYASALKSGTSTAWNPLYHLGYPTPVSPVGHLLEPITTVLLQNIVDPFVAGHLRMLISICLGMTFAYLFAIAWKRSRAAAFIHSSSYLVGYTLFNLLASQSMGQSFVAIPFLAWMVTKLDGAKDIWLWWLVGSLGLMYFWTFGFQQIVMYAVIIFGIYAFTLGRRTSLAYASSVASSVLLAAPLLWPTIEFRTLTQRIAGFGSGRVDGWELGDALAPFIIEHADIPYFLPLGSPRFALSAACVFFVIIGIVHFRKSTELRPWVWISGGIALLLVTPLGFGWLMQQLPIFSSFHTLRRLLYVLAFLLAAIAAFAFDALRLTPETERARFTRTWRWTFIISTGISALLLVSGVAMYAVPHELYTGIEYGDVLWRIVGQTRRELLHPWTLLGYILFPISGIIIDRFLRARTTTRRFTFEIAAASGAGMFVVLGGLVSNMLTTNEYLKTPEVVRRLPMQIHGAPPMRIATYRTGYSVFQQTTKDGLTRPPFAYTRESLGPNLPMLHGITRIDGYEPFAPSRHVHFWRDILNTEQVSTETFLGYLPALSAYGSSYILSGTPLEHPSLEPTSSTLAQVTSRPPLFLYKNRASHELLYIAEAARVVREWKDEYLTSSTHTIECIECAAGESTATGTIAMDEWTTTRIRASVQLPAPAWIISANSDLPGWEATIDGTNTPIRTADYLMQAIQVPSGTHRLEFSYTP